MIITTPEVLGDLKKMESTAIQNNTTKSGRFPGFLGDLVPLSSGKTHLTRRSTQHFFQNNGDELPDYMAAHFRKQSSL
jgi:hypothetical protein